MSELSKNMKVAVIGAGYMGSAITYPLSENGYKVNLVGTWLDDKIIESSSNGYHPKLKKPLPNNVCLSYWKDMPFAVKDADIIFIAVLSEGFVNVFSSVLDKLNKNCYFFKLTKGIVQYKNQIVRTTYAALDMLNEKFPNQKIMWSTVGGPVKAVELSNKIPTASVYGVSNNVVKDLSFSFSTEYYSIITTNDIIGVEISSAFKNAYSIAIGICDGLYKATHEGNYHNINAFLYNQACIEMSIIAVAAGGRKKTIFDLAGIGDFYVSSLSGRNRLYGELIGKGNKPDEIFKKMFEEGEVAEGYKALELGINWVNSLDKNLIKKLPLLLSLYKIVFEFKDPAVELKDFILKMQERFQHPINN